MGSETLTAKIVRTTSLASKNLEHPYIDIEKNILVTKIMVKFITLMDDFDHSLLKATIQNFTLIFVTHMFFPTKDVVADF